VILGIFSQYVTGWMAATRVGGADGEADLRDVRQQQISPGQLAIHADRGSSMTSKPVAFLLADLWPRTPVPLRAPVLSCW
jgi:putative transposase